MTPEERLQQMLDSSARRVLVADTEGAYARVLDLKRRRDATQRVVFAVLGIVLLGAAGIGFFLRGVVDLNGSVDPANPGVPTGPSRTGAPFVPGAGAGLVGEWQSAVIAADAVRAGLASTGISAAMAGRVMQDDQQWIVQLTFSGALVVETWDPARPAASLRIGPELSVRDTGNGRLVMTLPHPTTRWYFSYRVSGDRLDLHYLRSAGRPSPYTARLIAWTLSPTTLVH